MQNPPILTVTGTRRPHDRAGRISLLHRHWRSFWHSCENDRHVYGVTGENGLAFAARGTGKQTANTRGTPPARSRPACGLPLGARVVFRVCSGVARSEAFRLKSGLFINNRQTIRKPFEC